MPTESGGFDALLTAFDRFYKTLDAATVPADGGGRTVGGIAHAVALSDATNTLNVELNATFERLMRQHGRPAARLPFRVTLLESDSPDGPWTPVPAGEVPVRAMDIDGKGADPLILAAFESATKVTSFPIHKWNAMQAARPGANHQRFHAGEVVSAADLAALEAAAKLLRMKAPSATPTVSVSPDLLDRLQRAAAAVDPGAIDRAAERAAEKMAHALGSNLGRRHPRTEVVLWQGAEHNERNVRLARTRSAYLEAHGDVPAAMKALERSGNPVARSTFYNHLDALDVAIPRWRESVQLSNPTGNLDGMRIVGTRGKSRGKMR
ncbi:MAG: hypothetical protein KF705_00510 [Phycisphaeraceae bacterium]|nr:hypothetical protein [Phycisphaeraceae bacterium]